MIEKIDIENVGRFVNHWIESSDRDFQTMQNFYLKCTKQFTKTWIDQITDLRKWIKSQL